MREPAIKVEGLSKAYQLGEIGTGTISRDLERWFAKIQGKDDPFLRIGETNDRTSKGTSDVVWSLKDINFEIEQGDAVGIIGRNGAGKSTLLKILSRVTAPTTGKITGKGRIASLLEVGTGFHPELTGRENIFLNGAILGMRKAEIKKHFDAIVDFAGVERYVDTPVKRYSSGMYVRLAFAVAAHLESEILIVDEVLAVGDAEFQKKCLGKMGEVSKGEGRTVLFVSHNMDSVLNLCNKGILLKNGTIEMIGTSQECVSRYTLTGQRATFEKDITVVSKPTITFVGIDEKEILNKNFRCNISFVSPNPVKKPNIGLVIKNELNIPVIGTNCKTHPVIYETTMGYTEGIASVYIEQLPLHSGNYSIDIYLGDEGQDYEKAADCLSFDFISSVDTKKGYSTSVIGSLNVNAEWKIYKNDKI